MKLKVLIGALLLGSFVAACNLEEYELVVCESKPFIRKKHLLDAVVSSTNWSGYVVASNLLHPTNYLVTKVSGSWIVPDIKAAGVNTNCSVWVGIDGAGSPSVEQLGTEHDYTDGQESHYAWWEMFPDGSNLLEGFPVAVGDSISASVTFVPVNVLPTGNTLFILLIVNNTQKKYSIVPAITRTIMQRVCAEWIVEAPWLNVTLPLSDFGVAHMFNCSAEINGLSGPINNPAWQNESMNMVAPDGAQKAVTSALSADGKSFSVQWMHT